MISVIMSAYNAEKTVRRAAESILCGSYQDLELIIADDGAAIKPTKYSNKSLPPIPAAFAFRTKQTRGSHFL